MTTQRTFQNRACDLKPHNGPLCYIFATENHESESNPLINSTKILAFLKKKNFYKESLILMEGKSI